jgi:hypothetical protein
MVERPSPSSGGNLSKDEKFPSKEEAPEKVVEKKVKTPASASPASSAKPTPSAPRDKVRAVCV